MPNTIIEVVVEDTQVVEVNTAIPGPRGPQGEKGDSGNADYDNAMDLTLIYENGLV